MATFIHFVDPEHKPRGETKEILAVCGVPMRECFAENVSYHRCNVNCSQCMKHIASEDRKETGYDA